MRKKPDGSPIKKGQTAVWASKKVKVKVKVKMTNLHDVHLHL